MEDFAESIVRTTSSVAPPEGENAISTGQEKHGWGRNAKRSAMARKARTVMRPVLLLFARLRRCFHINASHKTDLVRVSKAISVKKIYIFGRSHKQESLAAAEPQAAYLAFPHGY